MLHFNPQPKPEKRASQRKRQRETRSAVISEVRAIVVKRDKACRVCRKLLQNAAGDPFGEMHELQSRAKLRGKPPREIFNTQNCVMLCHLCHVKITENKIDLVPVDQEQGANGVLEVQVKMFTGKK